MRTRILWGLGVAAMLMAPSLASAFCGFYVSGASTDLYNNATMVVMMRDGTRTVLSMQNNYQGPPEDFALVIPVPVVLQQENVKTLDPAIFDRVDQMAAPRLVEYWEIDPCMVEIYEGEVMRMMMGDVDDGAGHVVVEAEFSVGEYDIVVLSADDSSALDTWLRDNGYNIPAGAEAVLRPYVAAGMKFFVAKVNVERVTFAGGMATLSPLRFHYDSEEFSLPVRLGLLNANGPQDLIVHILAPNQRYEMANFTNVTIPTNLDVAEETRDRFAEFYATLFDKTLELNPGAVVTEYAWDASTCDPCPGPTLTEQDFLTLGADVTPSHTTYGLVLTRLHARYTADTLGDDLVFRAAAPITGGREVYLDGGVVEQGARPDSINNFQARYIIRHPWTGGPPVCPSPNPGRWGGPPGDPWGMGPPPAPAQDLAFAPRGAMTLEDFLESDAPEIGITGQ